jgi:hypothetical protein
VKPLQSPERAFVFYHAGSNLNEPKMLVQSIRRVDPEASVIQCSDEVTEEVPGVSKVSRFASDPKNLMTARLEAFANLGLDCPAMYLDTDMLMIGLVDPNSILESHDVMLCRRVFDCDARHSGSQRGIEYPEHAGRPLGEVYPYLACATVTSDARFWVELTDEIDTLDSRFHRWYGDQEAMRIWAEKRGSSRFGCLPESVYACLPEHAKFVGDEKLLHFKGHWRKASMSKFSELLSQPDLT